MSDDVVCFMLWAIAINRNNQACSTTRGNSWKFAFAFDACDGGQKAAAGPGLWPGLGVA